MNKPQIIALYLFTAVILIFGYALIHKQFKITDPMDSRFDPEKFNFCDYENAGEVKSVMKVMFPPGTSKEYIDRILIERNGAEHRVQRKMNYGEDITAGYYRQKNKLCSLHFKLPPSYTFWFYGSDMKLRNIE